MPRSNYAVFDGTHGFSSLVMDLELSLGQRAAIARWMVASPGRTDAFDAVDWTTKGVMTLVKNKRQCGSFWGSSNTGHIEDARSLATGSLQPLSKQQLVICDMVDSGCNGEFMNNAFVSAENVMCTNTCTATPQSRALANSWVRHRRILQ